MPCTADSSSVLAEKPDGILLSNGPGDPRELGGIIQEVKNLTEAGLPVLGICLGHQLLGLSLGLDIYKLKFGHHGGNHPVKDLTTGRCHITSQNHNYAVNLNNSIPGIKNTHINVNDKTLEGFRHIEKPLFGIQYHPEAAPGPGDSAYIFDEFIDAMRSSNACKK